MGGKSSPPPPDYTGAANAEATASKENLAYQTYANRADQTSPWGQQTWSNAVEQDPVTGQNVTRWSMDTTLTPEAQKALDSQLALQSGRSELGESLMGRASSEFGTALDYDSLSPWGETPDFQQGDALQQELLNQQGLPSISDPNDIRNRSEQAVYERNSSRLDPQWEQKRDTMEAMLVNRGLRPGDEPYDREMENLGRAETDAYQTARNESIMAGGAEATRQFGMEQQNRQREFGERLSAQGFDNEAINRMWATQEQQYGDNFSQSIQQTNYANALRQGQLAEVQGQRGQSLNEINALIAGQQVALPQQPSYNTSGISETPNLMGAAQNQYSGQIDQYNARQGRMQGLMSGLGTAATIAFSDRRLKRYITKIGEMFGYPFYRFQYIWGEWSFGVMSDEINQEAVIRTPSGFDMVNYGSIK